MLDQKLSSSKLSNVSDTCSKVLKDPQFEQLHKFFDFKPFPGFKGFIQTLLCLLEFATTETTQRWPEAAAGSVM